MVDMFIMYSFSKASYSYSQSTLRQFTQYYNFGAAYTFPCGIYLQTDIVVKVIRPQGSLAGQAFNLWNANLSKRILRKKALEVRASAFDILKSNKGFSQSADENYIASSNSLVLSRTLFVRIVYYFKKAL